MRVRIGAMGWAVITTGLIHGELAWIVSELRGEDPRPPTVIELREVAPKRPPPPKAAEPPKTPSAPAVKRVAAKPAAPKPTARRAPAPPAPATAAASAPPPSFGLSMSNTGGAGPAIAPARNADAPADEPRPAHKELAAGGPASGECADPIVKPKPIHVVQPAFTQDAQDAGITGKVRVEITISATGEITDARVIEGLGHGLDEAALEAARASTFSPATRCGQPVATTFTIGMRFQK